MGKNPRVRHLSRRKFPASHPCHVTLKVREGIASLRTVAVAKEVEATFRRCERAGFRLVHYSIQGNHFHAIVEANGREALGRGMMAIGIRFARAVNRALKRSGPVLKDRYHFRPLRTPTEVRNALRYVLLNARRHAAHLRERVRLDPASSARWFDGWKRGAAGEGAARIRGPACGAPPAHVAARRGMAPSRAARSLQRSRGAHRTPPARRRPAQPLGTPTSFLPYLPAIPHSRPSAPPRRPSARSVGSRAPAAPQRPGRPLRPRPAPGSPGS